MADATLVYQPSDKALGEPGISRRSSNFDTGMLTKTQRLLRREAGMLGAKTVVVQVDGPVRQDGQPAVTKMRSPAISVFIDGSVGALRYNVDTFGHWEDNLRAVALALEALRAVDRYGVTKRGEQYVGFKALPPGTGLVPTHMTLDVAAETLVSAAGSALDPAIVISDKRVVASLWRDAVKQAHPDSGGDRELWDKVQTAKSVLDRHHSAA